MSRYVYDKAEYHDDTVRDLGLPEEHAANHTVFFLRWLIEHSLMSKFFEEESPDILSAFREGRVSIHAVYEWWDQCLVEDMLSDDGNAFAQAYFDFDHGEYVKDYVRVLQRDLQSQFHVPYTEENYQAISAVIDNRFGAWRQATHR